jgi:hypothetical protein
LSGIIIDGVGSNGQPQRNGQVFLTLENLPLISRPTSAHPTPKPHLTKCTFYPSKILLFVVPATKIAGRKPSPMIIDPTPLSLSPTLPTFQSHSREKYHPQIILNSLIYVNQKKKRRRRR